MPKHLRIFSLGGNEVSPMDLRDPKSGKSINPDIALQWQRTAETCRMVANIIEKHPGDQYVLTHGNGPQVGNILLRSEFSRPILHPIPLDICGADSQGAMGYMLAQLMNELKVRGIEKVVAETVTQVVVDPNDPDFKDPTKFIGPPYSKEEARERAARDGWRVKLYGKDSGGRELWRRVVPSPVPIDILELGAVEAHLAAGIVPITVGGGGIPVMRVNPRIETTANGNKEEVYDCNYHISFRRPFIQGRAPAMVHTGIEAVVDKDLASALLGKMLLERARARGEDIDVTLAIFTNEDGAKLNYKKPDQKDLRRLTLSEAKKLHSEGVFPPGSMGPKINAVIKFIENGGKVAYITKTALFEKTLAGEAGTTIVPG